jgi:hypothetical protein
LTAPYFETPGIAEKALTNARFLIAFISLPHGACHSAAAENCPARSAGPCGDRKRLIGFCPRKSAFKTGVTPPTALSGSNLSSLALPEVPDFCLSREKQLDADLRGFARVQTPMIQQKSV